jgi:hypothetical protein
LPDAFEKKKTATVVMITVANDVSQRQLEFVSSVCITGLFDTNSFLPGRVTL